jgi:hypothetical protein
MISFPIETARIVSWSTMRSPPLLIGQNTCTVDSFQKEPEKAVHLADSKWSQARDRVRIQSRGLSRRVGHFLQCPTLHLAGDAFRQIFYKQNSLRNFEVRQALARMVSQFLFVGY